MMRGSLELLWERLRREGKEEGAMLGREETLGFEDAWVDRQDE